MHSNSSHLKSKRTKCALSGGFDSNDIQYTCLTVCVTLNLNFQKKKSIALLFEQFE